MRKEFYFGNRLALLRTGHSLLGVILLFAAFLYFMGMYLILPGGDFSKIPSQGVHRTITIFSLPGFLLFLLARMYIQSDAHLALSSDGRRPILLLRSFSDDEPVEWGALRTQFIYPSIESRLSRYFSGFGPFIAVGSPEDILPKIGAVRVRLTDDGWQAKVLSWIYDSRCVILMIGKTQWVQWELSKIIECGAELRAIFVFPPGLNCHMLGAIFGNFSRDMEERFIIFKSAFCGTKWESSIKSLIDPTSIRAIVLTGAGGITVVRSSSRSRNGYQLAIKIAFSMLSPVNHAQDFTGGRVDDTSLR